MEDIYDQERGVYAACLGASNKVGLLIQALEEMLKQSELFQNKQRTKKILDVGCGFGEVSLQLMNLLDKNQISSKSNT